MSRMRSRWHAGTASRPNTRSAPYPRGRTITDTNVARPRDPQTALPMNVLSESRRSGGIHSRRVGGGLQGGAPEHPLAHGTMADNPPMADRGHWPVRVFRLGEEPSEDLSSTTSPEERLAMVWTLTLE